ncbi:unnamed protein product [Rotaria magnacalcarata]|uniref:DUF4590 domain-containing protein n=1 Tax=Rotaria magnacalcarata TaxID=392030 RepID=A0A816RCQ5_9BILA|nr:unnamed protein product [Rotaria magnacalcarata]CAF2061121.1 unnamed protein product [Rotaria magnacalcarata]CAF2069578.1 unnamed protein product [Rotaria magnacalcarata]
MTDITDFNELTEKQFQKLLSIKHIRQHLIDVGLIDRHGQVISKHEYERNTAKHHSRRRVISAKNIEKFQTPIHRELTAASDEIIVMQQHCGGENVIVYKDALQSNQIFEFESRRHPDYPFALTFYVNGLIDNRLSICCESRYKHNVRLSGKRGLFGIVNVQKSKACKRCRAELRMKKLAKLKAKNKPMSADMLSTDSNPTEITSSELIMGRAMTSQGRHQSASQLPIESNQQKATTDLTRNINILNENLLSELDKNLRQEGPISKQTSNRESYESIVSAAKSSNHKKPIIIQQSNTIFDTLNGD